MGRSNDIGMSLLFVVACAALGFVACSDGDEEPGDAASRTGGKGGTGTTSGGSAGADAGPGAVYALTTQIFGETEDQSYVLLAPSLDPAEPLAIEDAVIEIPGRALGTGPDSGGVLFVAGDQGPTVTRYELSDSGRLSEEGEVSFLGRGVTAFTEYGGQFQYLSDGKAYYFDGATAQIVVWNPESMKVTDSVSLAELAHEGETLSFTAVPVRDGSALYTFAAWRKGLEVSERVAVVVVDTESDAVTIVEDDRCGYVRDGVLAADGFLYLATEAFGAAAHALNDGNPAPCLLRFDVENERFDPDFHVTLASLFDGDTAGSLIVGPNGSTFLRVLDASAVPEGTTNPRVVASAAAWSWARFSPGDDPVVERLDSSALTGGSVLPFRLGARLVAPVFVGSASTELVELTEDGPDERAALTVPGLVFSAVKLR